MKRSLFLSVALAAIVSGCSYDEVIDQQSPQAIGFGNEFIDNSVHSRVATDPSYTDKSLYQFDVWAWMAESVDPRLTFNGDVVTRGKEDGIWKVDQVRYWYKGFYTFAAVAPHADPNLKVNTAPTEELTSSLKTPNKLIKSIDFTSTKGTEDLIVAGQTRDNTGGTSTEAVSFTFHHLLSKVKFTFHNGFGSEEGYFISIKDIIIKAKDAGTYTTPSIGSINGGTWKYQEQAKVIDYNFGKIGYIKGQGKDECEQELMLIPADEKETYTIQFTVTLKLGKEENLHTTEKTLTHTLEEVTLGKLEIGKSYNINVTLDASNVDPEHQMNPIEFTVSSVDGWTPAEKDTDIKPAPKPAPSQSVE